jgi:hypothetical protein
MGCGRGVTDSCKTLGVDTAATIAIVGLILTASSPVVLSKLDARNKRQAALGDLRTAVIADAMLYAQSISTTTERLADPYFGAMTHTGKPKMPHADATTARMRLLAGLSGKRCKSLSAAVSATSADENG